MVKRDGKKWHRVALDKDRASKWEIERKERGDKERETPDNTYNISKYHFPIIFLQIWKRPKYIYNNLNMLKNKSRNPSPKKSPFPPPIQDSIEI